MTIVDPYGSLQLESQSSGFSRLVCNRGKSAADAGLNNGVDEALEGVSEAGRCVSRVAEGRGQVCGRPQSRG